MARETAHQPNVNEMLMDLACLSVALADLEDRIELEAPPSLVWFREQLAEIYEYLGYLRDELTGDSSRDT